MRGRRLDNKYDEHNISLIMPTQPSRKAITHERIVQVAARAVRRGGYYGVGVADIMKEAGLTHGGFYAHFASRDALLVEAMERAGRDNASALSDRVVQLVAQGEDRFAALVNSYLHDSQLTNEESGCVVAALASEMARQDEAVRHEARVRVLSLIDLVRRALPQGTDAGEAQVVTSTLVGALQLARALGGKAGKALLATTRDTLIARFSSIS